MDNSHAVLRICTQTHVKCEFNHLYINIQNDGSDFPDFRVNLFEKKIWQLFDFSYFQFQKIFSSEKTQPLII